MAGAFGVTPSISVVVTAYNQELFVRAAVESALAQTYEPIEVIVVNDGSTDGTVRALDGLRDRIRLINKENAGVAEARNTGVDAARGGLVAGLDGDDVWLPTKLARQVASYESDETVGLVHCGIAVVDQWLRPIEERVVGVDGKHVAERMLVGQDGALHPIGSTLLVERALLREIEPYDPRLPPSEDWDMAYRLSRRSAVGFVPEPLVLYRQHATNAHRDVTRVERGMTIAFEKAFDDPDEAIQRLRRPAYGWLHVMLAGSAWEAGDRRRLLRHAMAAVRIQPAVAVHFLGYPWRRLRRAFRRG
jgi:glycosyltransferase involved in cell wall biosynthesis